MQPLKDDRRAVLELGEDTLDIGSARKGLRAPREVGRVGGDIELRAGLGEAEAGKAEAAGAEEPLDVRDGQEVVEATFLRARDDERSLLPVALEELLDGDRFERAS
jgi:hypothetical protein